MTLDEQIRALEEQIDELSEKLKNLKREKAMLLCPYRIGEILVDRHGRQARLINILSSSWQDYRMVGVFLKKDGTEGKRTGELYPWDGWKRQGE